MRFIGLAILLLLAACVGQPSQSPSPASGSASPEATPEASASGAPSAAPSESPAGRAELAWERLEVPSLGQDSVVIDVEAAGPGFVALATSGPMGSGILTSPDGREWTAVPQPAWTEVGLVGMVEAADGRLIAVGRDTTDVDTNLAMVWISDDGVEWRQAQGGPDLADAQLIDVVETGVGFVAIGGYPTRDAAGIWTSPDGDVWTRAPQADSFEHAFMWAVAEGGPGLVAVGWRRSDDPSGFEPAFWTSPDGTEWTPAPTPKGAPGTQVRDIVASGDALVAAGDLLMGGQAYAWVSGDGTSWETVEAAESFGFEGALIADVATTPHGFLAVGGRNDDGGLWLSSDGYQWAVVDDPAFADASLVESLAVRDDVIVVGNTQTRIAGTQSYTWQPMIWYGARRP